MKTLTQALLDHFKGDLTSIATCWRVTRRDNLVLGFTDHDVNKAIDGINYVASSGYFRTAIANSATVAVDNLEIRGFLDDEMISEADLRNGAYDFAEVEIFAINWMDLNQGICRLRYGYFGEVTLRPSGMFVVELRGLMQLFSQTVGETISPDCRADLGDHRCKVQLLPNVRRNSGDYGVDERMIVPMTPGTTSIGLPIKNPNFDWYESTRYYLWEAFDAVVSNFPYKPHDEYYGLYYVKPKALTGSVRRRLDVAPAPGVYANFNFNFFVRAFAEGWEVSGSVESVNISGIGGIWDATNVTVLESFDIPWTEIVTLQSWVNVGKQFEDELMPAEGTHFRLIIRFRNTEEGVAPSSLQIDDPHFDIEGVDKDDAYMKFDIASSTNANGTFGWGGNWKITTPGSLMLMPETGAAYLQDDLNWIQSATQTVDLILAGALPEEIDEGNYVFKSNTRTGSPFWGYTAFVKFEFRSGSNQLLGSLTKGFMDLIPASQWLDYYLEGPLPPGTRRVNIELDGAVSELRSGDGSQPPTAFDSIRAELVHTGTDSLNLLLYGGVEYKALNAGTTAAEIPTFNHVMGEIVQDGEVSWQAVAPKYTFLGEITQVFNNSEFIVSGVSAPDNWFTWGVCRFLDGPNRTRGIEVLTFDSSTSRVKVMLPALNLPRVGDHVSLQVGCDKTRGLGGCKRFNNILNYRGEPEVPGTDQYFKVGGAGTSGTKSSSPLPDVPF